MLSKIAALGVLTILAYPTARAQQSPPSDWTAEQDHQNMMEQLGIKALRPGPSGNEKDPNHANYDEAKANPYRRSARCADVEERAEGDVAGTVVEPAPPGDCRRFRARGAGPRSARCAQGDVDGEEYNRCRRPGFSRSSKRQLVGHVDNSAYPAINVDIQMTLVTPGNAKGPVPVMIMFSSAAIRQFIASHPEFKKMMGSDPPATEQLIAGGWGYALLDSEQHPGR